MVVGPARFPNAIYPGAIYARIHREGQPGANEQPMRNAYLILYLAAVAAAQIVPTLSRAQGTLHDERELHLTEVRQLTFGGENAEAYWSPDGSELIFQSNSSE